MTKQVATVNCPKAMVGRVIGKNGETIKALQNYSGAQIQIDQTTDPMKVTITGTQQSLNLAISMVTDIVNGNFKGFAMLRQHASDQGVLDVTSSQPVYAPGYGLIPPSQVTLLLTGVRILNVFVVQMQATQLDALTVNTGQMTTEAAENFVGILPTAAAAVTPNRNEDLTASSYILSLAQTQPKLPTLTSTGPFSSLSSILGTTSIGALGLTAPEALTPTYVKTNRASPEANLSFSEFPSTGSPFSGSLSPDLSCGWSNGTLNGGDLSSALDAVLLNDLKSSTLPSVSCCSPGVDPDATQLHRISDFMSSARVASSSKGSMSERSDSTTEKNTASPQFNGLSSNLPSVQPLSRGGGGLGTSDNTVMLLDPSGRPFSMNLTTGETHWMSPTASAGVSENFGGSLIHHHNSSIPFSTTICPTTATSLKHALLSE